VIRAIIVDDEELSIKRLRRLVEESGWLQVCQTFQHPLEAYEYAKENPFDVAFLDISMPHVNGMKLSALLRALRDDILIVFVTGYEEYALQAFDADALDYVLKPIDEDRLARALDKIRRARRISEPEAGIAVQLFNGFKLSADRSPETHVKLRSPKTEELFAYLVCKGTASRDEIIEVLWPALDSRKALNNLNTHLYYIRRALGDARAHAVIQISRSELSVNKLALQCDLYEFDSLSKAFQQADAWHPSRIARAKELYSGPLLKGRDYDWANELARYYEQAYVTMLYAATRHCVAERRHNEAFRLYGEIIQRDVLREDIYYEMIQLYIETGRKADAIKAYRQLEGMMMKELGTTPDPSVTMLVHRLT